MSTIVQANLDTYDLAKRLTELVQVKTPRIAVVGDFCLDKYIYIYPQLDELSVETKLVAYQVRAKKLFAGVGGTIASNLRALGAETHCFGIIGNDGEGFELLHALKGIGANVNGMIVSDEIMTNTYVKPMRPNSPESSETLQDPNVGEWIESNRFDTRNPYPVPLRLVKQLQDKFLSKISDFDAIIVSDQFAEGSEAIFSETFRNFLSQTAKNFPDKFVLCDSRFFINNYRNAMVKCNANELFDAYKAANGGKQKRETTLDELSEKKEEELLKAGAWLVKRNHQPALITRGAYGSILFEIRKDDIIKATSIPSVTVLPPIDVCGAGDATNAGLVFAHTLGFDLVESAYIAGVVSSITIKQIGVTGSASIKQIQEVLRKK